MRPSGRWWFFVLAMALAWGGWWCLEGRRTGKESRPRDVNPGDAGLVSTVPASPEVAAPSASAVPDAGPSEPNGPPLADADGPPTPPEAGGMTAPPGATSDLGGLSIVGEAPAVTGDEAGPGPGNRRGFEGLPGVDDQVDLASNSVELAPDVAAALRPGDRARQEGRLADAERAFLATMRQPGAGVVEARKRLAEVYWLEGRLDEARELAESIWGEAERTGAHHEARAMLQFHLALGLNPLPIDRMQAALDRAIEKAPQDDRVWLGRGYLALRQGRLPEAQSWFDACRRRRPDDPAVWLAWLEWAMAADRAIEAREALPHLRADDLAPPRVHELRAWFAARRDDSGAERQALEQAVAADPGDVDALERLAALAAREGRAQDGARLRRRKADLDDALHRYRNLFRADDSLRDAAEMARLAESLGRPFEARGLWTIALELNPADADARPALDRLARATPARPRAARTLADALASDLSAAAEATPRASRTTAPRRVPLFRDDAKAAGLVFTFDNGATAQKQLPETMSGGVGLLDYDGDGRLDIYLVQGGTFPPDPKARPSGDRLFRNRGNGTFEDVTRASGLSAFPGGYGHGVAVGDYDNDGRPDVFVTRWRSYALYHNRGNGRFEDVTATAGLGGDRDWPTSSAFADLDGDGDLDLYVCHYLTWDAGKPEVCRSPATGRVGACDPSRFAARPDHLFRNDGGRFVDVTKEAGIVDTDGRGLGVIAADIDEDGRLDLFVANDGTANFLFLNKGGMRFEEAGHAAGVAAAGSGGYRAGMGIARGDLDGDGRPDLAVTNFFGESTTFYQNLGEGLFTDRTSAIGLAEPSRYRLGFGISFLDADDDGRLDLLTVNGHIADERPEIPYAMPAQLMLGGEVGRLADVSAAAGPPFQVPRLGRGLAVGDLDDDGRLDAVVLGHEGPIAYLHNTGPGGHSINVRLEGTRSNRDGVGARVAIESDGRRQVADRFGGGSYQSSGDPRLHFGLGDATLVDTLEVRWPSGRVDRFRGLAADAAYLIREGEAAPRLIGTKARRTAAPAASSSPGAASRRGG